MIICSPETISIQIQLKKPWDTEGEVTCLTNHKNSAVIDYSISDLLEKKIYFLKNNNMSV